MMNKTTVRKGTPEDVPHLLRLIVELAIYEKEPDAVIVTTQQLIEDGFGPHPLFGFFVAEHEGEIRGIALHYFKYSTWKGRCLFLEDIVVQESYRNQGIGKLLFDEIVKFAADHQCQRLEWQVLKWNTPAIEFYRKKYNANIDGEWYNGRLNADHIRQIASELSK
jgi:GNAT superfamily N-acetyltransferase